MNQTAEAPSTKSPCACRLSACLTGGMTPSSIGADVGLTVLRVFTGLSMAIAHGRLKLPGAEHFEPTMSGIASMGFPLPAFFGWAAILSEFVGALLLAAGLLTRLAAFFLLCTMGVAAFVVHRADAYGMKELALLYGCIAVAFLFAGAGRFSIDFLLRGRR